MCGLPFNKLGNDSVKYIWAKSTFTHEYWAIPEKIQTEGRATNSSREVKILQITNLETIKNRLSTGSFNKIDDDTN